MDQQNRVVVLSLERCGVLLSVFDFQLQLLYELNKVVILLREKANTRVATEVSSFKMRRLRSETSSSCLLLSREFGKQLASHCLVQYLASQGDNVFEDVGLILLSRTTFHGNANA